MKSGRQRAPEEGREGQPSSGGQIDGCRGRHRRRNGQSKKSSSANLNMPAVEMLDKMQAAGNGMYAPVIGTESHALPH